MNQSLKVIIKGVVFGIVLTINGRLYYEAGRRAGVAEAKVDYAQGVDVGIGLMKHDPKTYGKILHQTDSIQGRWAWRWD